MPWKRLAHLASGAVQSSDDATYTLELPRGPVIHGLLLKTEITNGSTSAQGLHIRDVIDLVEVVANGSERIVSLNADELEKWGMLHLGHPVPAERNEAASQVQMAVYPILFGRSLIDDEFFLPTANFSDLELQVRYSPTISATAFATGTTTFTVMAPMTMEGQPGQYAGTLKTTNVANFTSAASGDQEIDLPRGLPYRRILISAYEAGVASGTDITNVKFDVNNLQRVYIDSPWDDLEELNQAWYNLWPEYIAHLFRSDTDTVDTLLSNIQAWSLDVFEDVNITNDTFILDRIDTVSGDRLTINSSQADVTAGAEDLTAYTTDHDMMLRVLGRGLPNAVVLDFERLLNGQFLDSSQFDRTRLTLTQGGAGATVRVSLQEVKRFA